jgi:hypothetical protein
MAGLLKRSRRGAPLVLLGAGVGLLVAGASPGVAWSLIVIGLAAALASRRPSEHSDGRMRWNG